MRKLIAIGVLAGCGGIAAAAATRIFTNPHPEAHLKALFPSAAAFSPLEGTPLHFVAYAADPQRNPPAPPLGVAFWTTDLVPDEHGYHGPIHILVGLNMNGTIAGAIVDYDSEPYGYFSVEPPKFGLQFKGKTFKDPFEVGADVAAVSRASISVGSATRAIRDSVRLVAQQVLKLDAGQ